MLHFCSLNGYSQLLIWNRLISEALLHMHKKQKGEKTLLPPSLRLAPVHLQGSQHIHIN